MSQAAVLIEESTPYHVNEPVPKPVNYARSHEHLQIIRGKKNHAKLSTDLAQARDMQRIAHKAVIEMEQDLDSATDRKARKETAVALRMAIMAWDAACERVRIARNKPLPGSLRPENIQKKKKVTQHTFAEIPPPVSKVAPINQSQFGADDPKGNP
jgi:hypothetical protein